MKVVFKNEKMRRRWSLAPAIIPVPKNVLVYALKLSQHIFHLVFWNILDLIMLTKLLSAIKVVLTELVGSILKFPKITMFSKLLLLRGSLEINTLLEIKTYPVHFRIFFFFDKISIYNITTRQKKPLVSGNAGDEKNLHPGGRKVF